ncbi:MAG: hypothetical protein IPN33_25820 [Saprospiraceae bacterium]|nr:hypothetical protein [Saprospiraceae bacterium]
MTGILPQPNLNYINNPGFAVEGHTLVNEHGYRGAASSVLKPARTFRILFMGGSTTYCVGLLRNENTYPAYTGRLLDSAFKMNAAFASRYDSIECINAGLPGVLGRRVNSLPF